ncbi:hypothetical protein MHU86_4342 [Fragilaria crotonensis]|nr:hypothetical protein MHU86_4342 [Fragilaria crotonensis]
MKTTTTPMNHRGVRSIYSKQLKAHLLPGTFILFSKNDARTVGKPSNNVNSCGVARIVRILPAGSRHARVQVNIFKRCTEFDATTVGFLHSEFLNENHLRHLPEIVQMSEMLVISSNDILNLAFVFTPHVLNDDSCNMFFTCQGMALAFLLRSRCEKVESGMPIISDVPNGYCLPFPSSYLRSSCHDCYPSRIWNSIMCLKLEMTKLLGRYSHLQGLFCKEACRLSNFSAEAWGFLCLQFFDIFDAAGCGTSIRLRRHRVIESGLIVKAARVSKRCTILRFETKIHLRRLCAVFGESATAGQRCRLPKVSNPKHLWQNDIINVVCGSDVAEAVFNLRTVNDGIDLEFDGCSVLFVTIRYQRFAYTTNSLSQAECDPLLFALIGRMDPYNIHVNGMDDDNSHEADDQVSVIVDGSEFDFDGCLYRIVLHGTTMTAAENSTRVVSKCVYPMNDNPLYGIEKSFDVRLAKELIERRLNG